MQIHDVSLPDCRLAVHASGSGQPVLFLHAFPLDHRMWTAQAPLAGQMRLIMPDLRGFGGSRAAGGPTSIAQLADDMAALLDGMRVAEPVVVCGCSMGGYVAQHLAIRHPARVRAIVLVDTKLEADTPEARAARADLADKVRRLGQEIVADAMVPRLLGDAAFAADRPGTERLLRGMMHEQPVETIVAALAALGGRPDMTEAVRGIGVPSLLVVGAEDRITPPECLVRAAEIMPDSRLLVVPHAGHMVPLEAPEVFNRAVVDFLREVAARGP